MKRLIIVVALSCLTAWQGDHRICLGWGRSQAIRLDPKIYQHAANFGLVRFCTRRGVE